MNANHILAQHHVVIIIVIVIITMLTLCDSIMSYATQILFYHASMLTVHKLLNITCTLVATSGGTISQIYLIYQCPSKMITKHDVLSCAEETFRCALSVSLI
jgi:hypothetical protein